MMETFEQVVGAGLALAVLAPVFGLLARVTVWSFYGHWPRRR